MIYFLPIDFYLKFLSKQKNIFNYTTCNQLPFSQNNRALVPNLIEVTDANIFEDNNTVHIHIAIKYTNMLYLNTHELSI